MQIDHALIVGATGGIGGAMLERLRDEGVRHITATAREPAAGVGGLEVLDLTDQVSIDDACRRWEAAGHRFDFVVVATGRLHWEDQAPERRMSEVSLAGLQRAFEINAAGPISLLARLGSTLCKARRAVVGVLSARVGSISDNRLGGWYAYRMSKAALNMGIRTAAIEWRRSHPDLCCVGVHPGTVDTRLSKPFQGNVRHAIFDPADAADKIFESLRRLGPDESGQLVAYDGELIAP